MPFSGFNQYLKRTYGGSPDGLNAAAFCDEETGDGGNGERRVGISTGRSSITRSL